jgi:hypothetical protein
MLRDFVAGFREMRDLTCFRGPWAFTNIRERLSTPVETMRDYGAWIAAVLVQGEERHKRSDEEA